MPKTCILEPLVCDDKELQEMGKNLWVSVKKQLNSYGLGTEIIHTFNDMLQELNMSYSDYILAVRSTLVRAQFLGGLSLHLNHLIAERMSAPYWQFGTLPIGIFLSNLVSRQLETSLMTSYCHF